MIALGVADELTYPFTLISSRSAALHTTPRLMVSPGRGCGPRLMRHRGGVTLLGGVVRRGGVIAAASNDRCQMVGALESTTIHAADGEKHTRWQPLELFGFVSL